MARDGSWDDDDDLGEHDSSLDALAGFAAPIADGIGEAEEGLTVLFTVENPVRTVSVTVLVGGQIQHIGLENVTDMTEREVAEEIKVVANLAAMKAQSAQHAVVVELMHTMGHDRVMTGSFLEREIGLPSPESVNDMIAQTFSARRSPDGDWG